MDIDKILKKYGQKPRIDLGCGEHKQEGFLGVDARKLKGVDVVHDLEVQPWPLPDACASLIMASHLVEHINPHKNGFLRFMDEAWRILIPDGLFMIATPYAGSPGYFQDPTHINPCNEITFAYFDPLEPNTQGILWQIYKPKPWKVETSTWVEYGTLEVCLKKRREDRSYEPN